MGDSNSKLSTPKISSSLSSTYGITGDRLNGQKIKGTTMGSYVEDIEGDIIEFYHVRPFAAHAFVVCRTDRGEVFKCELIGDSDYTVMIRLIETDWRPGDNKCCNIKRKAKSMYNFIKRMAQIRKTFGTYDWGCNDCRHFSDQVRDYLLS